MVVDTYENIITKRSEPKRIWDSETQSFTYKNTTSMENYCLNEPKETSSYKLYLNPTHPHQIGHSSAISINLENPDLISVSIRKSNKISITETKSKTKININTKFSDDIGERVKLNIPTVDTRYKETNRISEVYDGRYLEGINITDKYLSQGDCFYNSNLSDLEFNLSIFDESTETDSNAFLIGTNYLIDRMQEARRPNDVKSRSVEESYKKPNKVNKVSSTERLFTNTNFTSRSLVQSSQENQDPNKENVKNSFQIFERNPFDYFKEYHRTRRETRLLFKVSKNTSITEITSNAHTELLSSGNITNKTFDRNKGGTDDECKIRAMIPGTTRDTRNNFDNNCNNYNMETRNRKMDSKAGGCSLQKKNKQDSSEKFIKLLDCTPDYYRRIFGPTLDETIISGMDVVYRRMGKKNTRCRSKKSSNKSKKGKPCDTDSDLPTRTTNKGSLSTLLNRIVSSTGLIKERHSDKATNQGVCTPPESCSLKTDETKKSRKQPEQRSSNTSSFLLFKPLSRKKSKTKQNVCTPPPVPVQPPSVSKSKLSIFGESCKSKPSTTCIPAPTPPKPTKKKSITDSLKIPMEVFTPLYEEKKYCGNICNSVAQGVDPCRVEPCLALKQEPSICDTTCENKGTPSEKTTCTNKVPIREQTKKVSSSSSKKITTPVIDVPAIFHAKSITPRETRFAITRILKFDDFTTYEIYKSTRAKPKCMPQFQEGIFVLKNRTIL